MNEEKRNEPQSGRGVREKLAAVCAALSLTGLAGHLRVPAGSTRGLAPEN